MMAVRPYTETDFPAVCRIYLDAKRVELAFEAERATIVPLERDAAILAAFSESDVMVVEPDGGHGITGFAAFCGDQLRALFVSAGARGNGAGGALLHAVMAAVPGPLSLNVARSNRAARRFYERHGFRIAGETVRQYGGNGVAYLIMRQGGIAAAI